MIRGKLMKFSRLLLAIFSALVVFAAININQTAKADWCRTMAKKANGELEVTIHWHYCFPSGSSIPVNVFDSINLNHATSGGGGGGSKPRTMPSTKKLTPYRQIQQPKSLLGIKNFIFVDALDHLPKPKIDIRVTECKVSYSYKVGQDGTFDQSVTLSISIMDDDISLIISKTLHDPSKKVPDKTIHDLIFKAKPVDGKPEQPKTTIYTDKLQALGVSQDQIGTVLQKFGHIIEESVKECEKEE